MAQTTHVFTGRDYQCGANTGAHGNKYQQDLAFVMFERCSLAECSFKLATEMVDAGKFDDVILFVDHLKEAWLFKAKHSISSKDQVSRRELFPDDQRYEGKDFDLYKYVKSYFYVEQNLKTDSVNKHYFIFTNKSFEESDELKKWVDISSRKVDKVMDFSKFGATYKGFKPKDDKIIAIKNKVNRDFLALKDAIIALFKTGTVERILNDYKTPLLNILEIAGNRLKFSDTFSDNNGDLSQRELHIQLQTHFQQKKVDMKSISIESNKAIKDLLNGRSRNVQLPPFVDAKFVTEFFKHLTFCLNQPSDLRPIIDDDLRLWLRSWIRPDDLGRFGESQMVLPRVKFDEVFKSWNEPNMSKGQNKSKDKSFLSYDTGKKCVQDITNELKQFVSKHSDALDRYYVNRFLKVDEPKLDNQKPISDEDFVKKLEENFDQNKCTILIAEPGMGKTTFLQRIGFEVQKRFKRDVYLIYLKNIDKNLKIEDNTDVKRIVSDMFKNVLSSIGLDALKDNLEKDGNRILVIFDGFDEIAPSQVGNIITIFKRLKAIQNLQVIISGKKHVQESLEQNLNLNYSKPVVINLIPFVDADQRKFLKSFWNIPSDQEADVDWQRKNKKFNTFSTLLLRKFYSDIGRRQYNFTGLPLMIRMLAEIHTESFYNFLGSESADTREIFSSEKFSVLKLFEKFVEISFYMKTKKKLGQEVYSIVESFDKDYDWMEMQFDQFVLEHQLVAIRQLAVKHLKHIIDDKKYSKINARLLKRIETGNEKSLLINFTSEENPVEFVHLSYAEYFVAKYLFDNAHNYLESLFQILQKYEVVRRFFFSQIEENFDSNLKQITIVDNICNTQPDVAFWACEGSCVKVVRKLLENRNFQTKQNHRKDTLLHVAVQVDCSALVEYLLCEHGIKVDVYNNIYKKTPLHIASEEGHLEVAKMLIDASAKLEATNGFGQTPLHLAAKNNHLELVLMLIDQLPYVKAQDKWCQLSSDLADGKNDVFNALIDRFTIEGVEDAVGRSLLHVAINNGYFEEAKIMIGRLENINNRDIGGMTPLHHATEKGLVEIAELLIAQSANAEVKDKDEKTPLHLAAAKGLMDLQEDYGNTPLHLAAKKGHRDIAKMLIAESADVEIQNEDGETPLHLAAEKGHLEISKMIIAQSADVEIRNKYGKTPLHLAAKGGHWELLVMLINQLPNVAAHRKKHELSINSAAWDTNIFELLIEQFTIEGVQDKVGRPLLHLAIERGDSKFATTLIEQSVNVDARDNNNKSPIHLAVANGNLKITKLLIDQSANIDARDNDGQTPLHIAAEKDRLEIAKMLLEYSANVDVKNNAGETPIHKAFSYFKSNDEIIKMLVDHSADVNAQENEGQTPLHLAARYNRLEVAKMLIDHSADVNAQENDGKTPLHLAAARHNLEIVKLLIDRSAFVDVLDNQQQTPLQLVAERGHLEIAKMLIAQSADVDVQNIYGQTPLHLAEKSGQLDMVKMLRDQSVCVDKNYSKQQTPFHWAKKNSEMLLGHSANADLQQNKGKAPHHIAVEKKHCEMVKIFLNHSANGESKYSEALDRYYVNRFFKVLDSKEKNQKPVSDVAFMKQMEENFDQKKCTILIAEPGMGKTTLLQYIGFEAQKRFKRDVYLIYLKNINKNLTTIDNTDVKYMVCHMLKDALSTTGLDALKNNLENKGKSMLLLFDGFDEIASSQVGNTLALLKRLQKNQTLQLIISGRKHVQESLEHNLSLDDSKPVVINLIPFMDAEQRKFLKSFWKIPSDQEADDDWERKNKKFDIFSTLLLEKFHSDIGREQFNFTGLPLMIRMLAEIHTDSFNNYLGSEADDTREIFNVEHFSVLKLFEKFVEISFNMKTKKKYGQEAYSIVEPFDKDDDEMETLFDHFVLEHQLIAIRQLEVEELNHVIEDDKYSKINARFLKRIKTGNEKSVLINFTSEENPVEFVHLSYAEYFVATYLYDNAHGFLESLFQILKKYHVVRRFFFSQIEENFDSNLKQLTIVDNICNMHPDVAFWACEASCVEVVKKLLQNRNFQTNVHLDYGSLLHVAVEVDCSALVSYLLNEHRIEADIVSILEQTPLHLASEKGHLEIAKILIDASANLEVTTCFGTTPLHLAACYGHIEITRNLLSRSANVNSKNIQGNTPLHMAAEYGHLEIAKLLIDKSAKVEVSNISGETPLHLAVKHNYLKLVLMLINQLPIVKANDKEHHLSTDLPDGKIDVFNALIDRFTIEGVQDAVGRSLLHVAIGNGYVEYAAKSISQSTSINDRDINGMTPLHYAAEKGLVDTVMLMIDQSANPEVKDENGQTPLHLAVKNGQLETVKMLLKCLVYVNAQDGKQETPLHLAIQRGHLGISMMLLACSADADLQQNEGKAPLHIAVENNHWEIAETLLDHSANAEAEDKYRRTPLHKAAENGRLEIAKFLVVSSANVEARDRYGKTPLHLAVENKRIEVAIMLIENSGNVEAEDDYGQTPLHLAVAYYHLDTVRMLIHHSANVQAQDIYGKTPLHLCVENGHLDTAKMLIDHSADVNTQENKGQTPLHKAVLLSRWEIVKLLIDKSANVDVQDFEGKTLLHLVAENDHISVEISKMLLDRSINVNARDNNDMTPLHLAAKYGRLEFVKMLIDRSAHVDFLDNAQPTPLQLAAKHGYMKIANTLKKYIRR